MATKEQKKETLSALEFSLASLRRQLFERTASMSANELRDAVDRFEKSIAGDLKKVRDLRKELAGGV